MHYPMSIIDKVYLIQDRSGLRLNWQFNRSEYMCMCIEKNIPDCRVKHCQDGLGEGVDGGREKASGGSQS